MFPLPEPSQVSYNAPLITSKTLEAFRFNDLLRQSLCSAFIRILAFYGLEASVLLIPNGGSDNSKNALPTQVQEPATSDSNPTLKLSTNTSATAPTDDSQKQSSSPGTRTALSANLSDVANAWHAMNTFQVVRGPNFRERASNWCVPMDHNHLRITRILRCLRVLGLEKQCEEFYTALKDVYDDDNVSIAQTSMKYWTRAVREPIHIAPDGTKCRWLKDWHAKNQSLD